MRWTPRVARYAKDRHSYLVTLAAGQGNVATMFVPNGMQALRSQVGVGLSSGFFSCLSCGYVWTRLPPDQLRQFIRTNGDELVKQCLDFLEHGPDHDLPDVPEAQSGGSRSRRD